VDPKAEQKALQILNSLNHDINDAVEI